MKSRWPVFALFFFSGVAGLIYQVLWLRRLAIIFGVTAYAASTVLAAFMAGLAIGSLLAGRVLRRRIAPLAAFGIAEILIGVTGLASPILLEAASSIYVALHAAAPDSLALLTAARLVCSFAILAVPTAMMGVTLPLLSAAVAPSASSPGSSISLLYAVNTTGAMAGAIAAGLVLIPAIGIQMTFVVAAGINVIAGVLALWMQQRAAAETVTAPVRSSPPERADRSAMLHLAVVASGFAGLGLEVVWFRLLLQFVVATTEAFTAMLATVLAGIAIGGFAAARLLRLREGATVWLTASLVATGVLTVASMRLLLWTVQHGWDTMGIWRVAGIAILPPAILMGMGFPLALGHWSRLAAGREASGIGHHVGRLYALNVMGAIAGSLIAGFVLLPRIGAIDALIAMSGIYLASGVLLALSTRTRRSLLVAAVAVAAFIPAVRHMPDPFKVAIDRRYGDVLMEFWRDEGAQTAVSVRASRLQHVLYLDGLHQANDQPAMVKLHRTLGLLPMVLHRSPHDVLVVGLGGGTTPGAISQYPGAQIQVVELSDGVVRAAPFFAHVNFDVANQKNVAIRVDDGRNFLRLTDRRFDVVTADVIQPGHAGAGLVYSREYFTLVRGALKPGGVVLQWIGRRPSVEYKLIVRTFLEVFPNATLWSDGEFLVGTVEPLRLDPGRLAQLRTDRTIREVLDGIGLKDFDTLRSWYMAGAGEMRAFVGAGPVLTDDRPLVEYHHWLPAADRQAPLDLSTMKGDVSRLVVGGGE